MPLKSSGTKYGSVAVTIHWLSAVLIVAVLGSGFRAADIVDPATKVQLLRIHVPLAFMVALLMVSRLLWWWFADRKPDPVAGTAKWQQFGATAIHWLFYVTILGMVASGIGLFVLSGAGPMVFGNVEGQLPDFWNFKPRVPHGIGARAMLLLLVLHVGAALFHHFVRGDGLLWRMWFGRP